MSSPFSRYSTSPGELVEEVGAARAPVATHNPPSKYIAFQLDIDRQQSTHASFMRTSCGPACHLLAASRIGALLRRSSDSCKSSHDMAAKPTGTCKRASGRMSGLGRACARGDAAGEGRVSARAPPSCAATAWPRPCRAGSPWHGAPARCRRGEGELKRGGGKRMRVQSGLYFSGIG